jgi:predicted nucleic acid-binding protein
MKRWLALAIEHSLSVMTVDEHFRIIPGVLVL